MSPRFSHVFQFGQRWLNWLNWLNRQLPDTVRTVVMETMVKRHFAYGVVNFALS